MKKKDVWELNVTDRKSFEQFINLLLSDFKNNKENWENNRLDLFLGAMAKYTADLDGYYKNFEPESNANIPTWKVFADIMRGAVVYE